GDLAAQLPEQCLFLIQRGLLHVLVEDRALFYLRDGDLLGLRQDVELPSCRYRNDEPVNLIPYDRRAVMQHIHASEQRQELFTQYLIGRTTLLPDALARLKQPENRPTPGFQYFAAGE